MKVIQHNHALVPANHHHHQKVHTTRMQTSKKKGEEQVQEGRQSFYFAIRPPLCLYSSPKKQSAFIMRLRCVSVRLVVVPSVSDSH